MRKSIVLLFTFLLVTSVAIAAPNFKIKQTTQVQNRQDYVEGQILVKFRDGIDDTKIVNSYSSSIIGEDSKGGFKYISIPANKTVEEMVATYSADLNVLYAEPDYIYRSYAVPNDPFYVYQWHMPMINMEQAWDNNAGAGVIVAVLDVGVAYENFGSFAQAPDLAQTNFVAGYDFINNDSHPNDDNGHGTHVTGTIAQSTNNNLGVAGIAYNSTIMPVKVLDGAGSGASSVIANGIYFAADNGAQVINMSLGSSFLSTTIQDACNYAKNKGVILICAAGNSGRRVLEYPAALDACVSVSAVRFDSTLAGYSTYNDSVDITAPGGDTGIDQDGDGYVDGVLQQTHNGVNYSAFSYYFYQGTSMACPHVAGAAALVISASGGNLTPDEVQAILQNSSVDLGAAGWDNRYGHGLLDANAAVLSAGSNTNPPTADFSGTPLSGTVPLTVNFSDISTNTPTSWTWDFGDGGTSTAQNPSYTYNTSGTYTVALTATNANGSDTKTSVSYITVNPCVNPTASFSGSPTSGTEPLTVNFTDGSSGATSWSWNFGDASTSTQQNPSHTYAAAGTYTVSLTATNACGSNTSTMNNYITVNPCVGPTAGFSGAPLSGDYPLVVSFTDGSSGATSLSWDFGDGGTSTASNPSYTYTTAGTYSVTQTVTNFCGSDVLTMTNYITVTTPPCSAPVASFAGTPTTGNVPLSVSFSDASTNAPTSWAWDFGDGGTSSAQNPAYTYNSAGSYTVSMTATNSCGSNASTMTNYITVNSGPIAGEGFILSRNADFSTDDRSFGNNETMYVKMWTDQVDFNNISRARFELRNASKNKVLTNLTNNFDNTYTGSFNMANLPTNDVNWDWKGEAKDNAGNRYKPVAAITITAGPPPAPVADFSGNPTTGFAPLAVNFSDLSTNSPTSWAWDFGDGGTSTVQNPSHSYASAGSYTVSLTATNSGGNDINTKANYITANVCTSPTAGFSGTPTTGDAPLAVSFSDASTGATSWAWDFGDGGNSNAQNPNYTYATPGTYSVSLTATNSCGNNISTRTNYITVNTPPCNPPVASFSGTPTTGNAPLNVSFTDATSNAPTSWAWDFGDGGTSSAQNPTYSFGTAGTYTVSMTATNACGTNISTMTNYITVNAGGPVTGEGFILSRNADFSTDDRNFNNNEIMYVKLWSDVVDFNDINRARFEMKDANKNKIKPNLTNNFDGTYTGQLDLMTLPSGAASWTWKGEAKDNAGNSYKPSVTVTVNMIVSNGNSVNSLLADNFGLNQNYPNPFNPTTSVSFMLETASTIKLEVYNTNGQKVETLASGSFSAGQHTFEFDASNLSSGVYLYKLTTDGIVETKKMLLLK